MIGGLPYLENGLYMDVTVYLAHDGGIIHQ